MNTARGYLVTEESLVSLTTINRLDVCEVWPPRIVSASFSTNAFARSLPCVRVLCWALCKRLLRNGPYTLSARVASSRTAKLLNIYIFSIHYCQYAYRRSPHRRRRIYAACLFFVCLCICVFCGDISVSQ